MATTFQLAHCVEEASFASPDELRAERRIWAVHEVETTVDFCPRNPVLTWMLGGLNFQIEHHLFPKVPHTHYPKIAEIVRRNCAKHGVRYSSHPSLGGALALALPPSADDGPARPAARDRDGVAPASNRARRARADRRPGSVPSTTAPTSSPIRSTVPPITVRNAVSAASRPVAMRTSDERGASSVASTTRQVPSTSASATAWKSIGCRARARRPPRRAPARRGREAARPRGGRSRGRRRGRRAACRPRRASAGCCRPRRRAPARPRTRRRRGCPPRP